MADTSIWAILTLLFSFLSASACLWLLGHLWKLPKDLRKRLFWGQFMALAATDFVEALIIFATNGLDMFAPVHQDVEASPLTCKSFVYIRYILEFSSCLLEVQIAAGFAAACYRLPRVADKLRCGIALSWFGGVVLLLVAVTIGMQPLLLGSDCSDTAPYAWGIVVFVCCTACLAFYAVSVWQALKAPMAVRNRAVGLSFIYVANFICTFGVRAVVVMNYSQMNAWIDGFSFCLVCLNGLVNVFAYVMQSRQALARSRARTVQFQVNFSPDVDIHAVASDQREHFCEAAISILDMQGLDTSDLRVAIERHFELADEYWRGRGEADMESPAAGTGSGAATSGSVPVDTGIRVHSKSGVVVY